MPTNKKNRSFDQRIDFIKEVDKLKSVFRHTYLFDGTRNENDAEHSWHLAIMAIVLEDCSNERVDIIKVIKMVLIHDLVEIDSGDFILYTDRKEEKLEKEKKAAERIFGLLPKELRTEFTYLWKEFEEKKTPEARFAAAIDRLEPIMQNHATGGRAWKKNGIKLEQVIEANRHIAEGSESLWEYAKKLIENAEEEGFIS